MPFSNSEIASAGGRRASGGDDGTAAVRSMVFLGIGPSGLPSGSAERCRARLAMTGISNQSGETARNLAKIENGGQGNGRLDCLTEMRCFFSALRMDCGDV